MKQCMDADNLHRRLKKIIGQVQAIDRMVDEDVPCEDVLAQITLPAEQKKADIGIAMGGVGSDIALDAADIALVDDEVKELPHLIALSRRMMITIKCNLSFSMGLNFLAIVLAITGILNPVVGALVHNAGSIVVIINSALLLNNCASHSRYFSDELDAQFFCKKSKQMFTKTNAYGII